MDAEWKQSIPRLSLVIPAYNEEHLLPRLLASIKTARSCYAGPPQDIEVIVADNASTDHTPRIAAEAGCKIAPVERRMIAAARNGGAAMAVGECIGFVDADSVLHPSTFQRIIDLMDNPTVIGGATGVQFDRQSIGVRVTYVVFKILASLANVESGVVFCRRSDFEQIGGYPEDRHFAEDIAFLRKLKALGRKRRQRFKVLDGCKTLTSSRKFDQFGDWHFFGLALRGGWHLLRGRRAYEEWFIRYWYDVRRH